jgi:hypothetical protein
MARGSATPAANTFVKATGDGTIDPGWLPEGIGVVVVADETARDALTAGWDTDQRGFLVFQSDTQTLYVWDGTEADPAGGGGGSISAGVYASRPAAGTAGRLYLATDADTMSYDTGAAWLTWRILSPVADPSGSFAWVNQGGAAVATTHGALVLSAPASATHQVRARVKTAPSAPYTLTVAMRIASLSTFSTDAPQGGIVLRNSGDGKLVTLSYSPATGEIVQQNWTDHDSVSGSNVHPVFGLPSDKVWLQIEDNNTNRYYRVSADGWNWLDLANVVRSSHTTPDQVGFFASAGDGNVSPAFVTLLDWREA